MISLLLLGERLVVCIAEAVPDLLELVQTDLSRLIDSLYDVSGHVVGEFALLPASPKFTSMRVILAELAGSGDSLALHILRSMFPHTVEACAVRVGGCFGEVHPHSKFSTRDETGSTWPFGLMVEGLWPSFTFRHFLTSNLIASKFGSKIVTLLPVAKNYET